MANYQYMMSAEDIAKQYDGIICYAAISAEQ